MSESPVPFLFLFFERECLDGVDDFLLYFFFFFFFHVFPFIFPGDK
jgi:hypothetical protein